jgi:hypothetical protein
MAHTGLQEFTASVLAPERVRRAGLLLPAAVEDLRARLRRGEGGLANHVLSLLALHLWWEDYLGDDRAY